MSVHPCALDSKGRCARVDVDLRRVLRNLVGSTLL